MASELIPLAPTTLAADYATLHGLQSLSDYQPSNPECTIAQLIQAAADIKQAEQVELDARDALRAARRRRIALGHIFHNLILTAKAQVIAQYGADSIEVDLIGLTRKSDYRWPKQRRARRPKPSKG